LLFRWARDLHAVFSRAGIHAIDAVAFALFTRGILDISATTALPPDSPTLSAEVIRAREVSQ
jgi:hypothetical protein